MIMENYTMIRLYSETNLDMDYFFLFEIMPEIKRREVKEIILNAENDWWEDGGDTIAELLPEYVSNRLKEEGYSCIGYLTNETHKKENEYILVYNVL